MTSCTQLSQRKVQTKTGTRPGSPIVPSIGLVLHTHSVFTEYLSKVLFKRKQILLFPQVMFPLFIKYLSGAHQNFLTRRVWKKNYYWGDIFISSSTNEFYLIIFHSTKVLISYGYRSQKAQNNFGHFFSVFIFYNVWYGILFLKKCREFWSNTSA